MMGFKFWQWARRAQTPDFTDADDSLHAARQRLDVSARQLKLAHELKRRSERTLAINHFRPMIEDALAAHPRSEP